MLYRPLSSPARKRIAEALLGAIWPPLQLLRQRRADARNIESFRADQLRDLGLSEPDISRHFPSQDPFAGTRFR